MRKISVGERKKLKGQEKYCWPSANRPPDISWQQQRIQEQQRIEIGDMCKSRGRRGAFFYGFCEWKIHWRKLEIGSTTTFHCLSNGSLSLAELSWNLFFSFCWGSEVGSLPVRGARSRFSQVCSEQVREWEEFSLLAFQLHFECSFCLLNFTISWRKYTWRSPRILSRCSAGACKG